MAKKKRTADTKFVAEFLPTVRVYNKPVAAVMFASYGEHRAKQLQDGVRLDLCCRGEGIIADEDKIIPWDERVLERGFITVKLDIWEGYEHVEWAQNINIVNENSEPLKVGELARELGFFVRRFVEKCDEKEIIPTSDRWSVGEKGTFPMSEISLDNISTEDWEIWWVEVQVLLSATMVFERRAHLIASLTAVEPKKDLETKEETEM